MARDWNDPARERLWLYNAHYFDDLSSEDAAARISWHVDLIDRWISDNPPAAGAGWEPYPTSVRIVNWIKWVLAGGTASPLVLQNLAVQVRWLAKRIEHHLLANHLFVNGKALVVAGLFFDGPESKGWRELGLKILARELPEQVLVDGGQFERSPMYHALALEDILDLINFAQAWPGVLEDSTLVSWREAAVRMQGWLHAMSHPDGQISFFGNDAAPFDVVAGRCRSLRVWVCGAAGHRWPALVRADPARRIPDTCALRLAEAAMPIADVAPVRPGLSAGACPRRYPVVRVLP